MKTATTQTATVVVGSPDPEVFIRKTTLGAEDTLCNQCGGQGSHWWHPIMWALGLVGHAANYASVLRIPLVSGQGNKEVPAVAGMGVPFGTMEMRGEAAPPSTVAEQVAVEGLLALASLL